MTKDVVAQAAAVAAATQSVDDVHSSAGYRREMAAVLTRRAIQGAASRSTDGRGAVA
nr:hypothetical protein [Pseudonocardia asaccharolytica]